MINKHLIVLELALSKDEVNSFRWFVRENEIFLFNARREKKINEFPPGSSAQQEQWHKWPQLCKIHIQWIQ